MEGPWPLGGAGRDGHPRLWQVGNVTKVLVNLVTLGHDHLNLTNSFQSVWSIILREARKEQALRASRRFEHHHVMYLHYERHISYHIQPQSCHTHSYSQLMQPPSYSHPINTGHVVGGPDAHISWLRRLFPTDYPGQGVTLVL